MRNVRFVLWLFFLCAPLVKMHAQQITRFAVVDTSRIYASFSRDTGQVKNYEKKRDEFQKEIDKQTAALKQLQSQKAEYELEGNTTQAARLDSEITKKMQALTEYTASKNVELESMRKNLQMSDAFTKRLYATLKRIAESEGYSVVMSLQDANGILWYSPSVDITDAVINGLSQ
ncbi:MAG: OmpH family outer membrane protein [Treponemataceae bacterium]|nr:MAG: OmpH family outer membrane protein [Treponemataceae bacterium]